MRVEISKQAFNKLYSSDLKCIEVKKTELYTALIYYNSVLDCRIERVVNFICGEQYFMFDINY